MLLEESQRIDSFIKYFLTYTSYLEKKMANETYNFNEIRIILDLLENEKMHAKDIESHLDLDKGYTSRILKRLMDDGIIQREQSTDDKRLYHLSFSKKGRKLAEEMSEKYQRIIEEGFKRFDSQERAEFIAALELIENLHKTKYDWQTDDE